MMVADIIAVTAEHFGMDINTMLSRTRTVRVSRPRNIAMYIAYRHSGKSSYLIGQLMGGREGSTVRKICHRVRSRIMAHHDDVEAILAKVAP